MVASTFFPFRAMGSNSIESLAICQACGKSIMGKTYRFKDVLDSAFCSLDCQVRITKPIALEVELAPITAPHPCLPVYMGPMATKLHYDCGCECDVYYENQIIVPKRHSVIRLCPKCGCVTVD